MPRKKTAKPDGARRPASRLGRPDIDAFFRRSGISIIAVTVKDILDEQIARKLA